MKTSRIVQLGVIKSILFFPWLVLSLLVIIIIAWPHYLFITDQWNYSFDRMFERLPIYSRIMGVVGGLCNIVIALMLVFFLIFMVVDAWNWLKKRDEKLTKEYKTSRQTYPADANGDSSGGLTIDESGRLTVVEEPIPWV